MFLIRSLDWYGGAQRQLVNLASGLSRVGHDVTVVTYYMQTPLERDLEEAGVEVRSLGKRSRWDLLRPIARFLCLVRKSQPAVLHGYLSTANILAVLAKACCPPCKVVWGVRASNMHWDEYDWLHKLSFLFERALSRFADLLIFNSYSGRDHYASCGFPKDKMIVIHNGIDTSRFRPDKEAGLAMRRQWGIDKEDRVVCLVGRLDPMKDHITFLRAAALLSQRRSGLRFVCVGEGPGEYESALRVHAEREGVGDRIMWAGCFYDMRPVYNACDVVDTVVTHRRLRDRYSAHVLITKILSRALGLPGLEGLLKFTLFQLSLKHHGQVDDRHEVYHGCRQSNPGYLKPPH